MVDNITNMERAEVLIKALPYIQEFMGKTIVVKYGGNAMINEELKAAVIQDLVLMSCVGINTVLVHGGGPEIEAMLRRLNIESRFIGGLRYTDAQTIEVVQMVLCGKLNKDIVSLIGNAGGKALGLCGLDGGLLRAVRLKTGGEDLGFVGEISSVDPAPLLNALGDGYIPVVSTLAQGTGNDEGITFNINADTAAAKIAAALGAEKLILMTDVAGLLRDVNDSSSLIKRANLESLDELVQEGAINKGMIPKVDCCKTAIQGGVRRAHIIDGRVPHSILVELFTDEGVGTMIGREV